MRKLGVRCPYIQKYVQIYDALRYMVNTFYYGRTISYQGKGVREKACLMRKLLCLVPFVLQLSKSFAPRGITKGACIKAGQKFVLLMVCAELCSEVGVRYWI